MTGEPADSQSGCTCLRSPREGNISKLCESRNVNGRVSRDKIIIIREIANVKNKRKPK